MHRILDLKCANYAFICINSDFQLGVCTFKLGDTFLITLDIFHNGDNLNQSQQLVYNASKMNHIYLVAFFARDADRNLIFEHTLIILIVVISITVIWN